jgi:hypothetical protein
LPPKDVAQSGSWLPSRVIVPLGRPTTFGAAASTAENPATSPEQRTMTANQVVVLTDLSPLDQVRLAVQAQVNARTFDGVCFSHLQQL